MKTCPYCAEEIKDEAIVCRYCGRDLVSEIVKPNINPEQPQKVQNNGFLIYWLVFSTIITAIIYFFVFIILNNERIDTNKAYEAYFQELPYNDTDEYYYDGDDYDGVCSIDVDGDYTCYAIEELHDKEKMIWFIFFVISLLFFIGIVGEWFFYKKRMGALSFILSVLPFLPFCFGSFAVFLLVIMAFLVW